MNASFLTVRAGQGVLIALGGLFLLDSWGGSGESAIASAVLFGSAVISGAILASSSKSSSRNSRPGI